MILSLCLLLPALSPSSQEICSAPGALRGPILYLNQTSARPGDFVLLQCSVFSRAQATRVIFCKDGEEVSSQTGILRKVTYNYDHVVSGGSTGNYSCGYEVKNSKNRVIRSQLSPAQHLSVTGDDSSSGGVGGSTPQGDDSSSGSVGGSPPLGDDSSSGGVWSFSLQGTDLKLMFGITIPVVVVLAVVFYLLGKKAVSLPRDQRERVQHGTSNTLEDHIEYASVNCAGSTGHPPPQGEEMLTYAAITLQRDRCH